LVGVYPGSFDLITNGHFDVIRRSSKIFDTVYVAVMVNKYKKPLFSLEERINQLELVTNEFDNIKIVSHEGLLVDFLKANNIKVIIRGVRSVSEFETEFQLANGYKFLDEDIETFLMSSSSKYQFLSSTMVKEVASFGGDLTGLVPEKIKNQIIQKFKSI